MATRIYGSNPGGQNVDVVEAVGPTATSAFIAVVVDLASTVVNDKGTTRTVNLEEVILALENIKAHILRTNTWPPA